MKIDISDNGFMETEKWLLNIGKLDLTPEANQLGKQLVQAVRPVTPIDTGLTQKSWSYKVVSNRGKATLSLVNSSENGFNVVQALRRGHGTGTGGYVPPNDFVTPVVEPIIDNAANKIVKRVVK